jgi:hypothetical protein
MSFNRRSPDDLPLAAYTTGVAPDDDESAELVDDPGYISVPAPSTPTADMQHGHAPGEAEAAAAAGASAAKRRGPRLSLRLPSLGRSKAALQEAAPFQPVKPASAPAAPAPTAAGAFQAVTGASAPPPAFATTAAYPATRPFEPVTRPAGGKGGPPSARPAGSADGARARRPGRLSARDPRLLAGGVIAVGVVLLVASLLGGGSNAGTAGPNGSQGTGGVLPTAAVLGNASVELTAGAGGTFTLTGASGAGPAVDNKVNATWTDPLGESLGLSGMASQGTRTTDVDFVLSWTMLIDNVAVAFTSRDKECTIGMAVGVRAVSGTFHCKHLKSDDGKHEVDLFGSYTT